MTPLSPRSLKQLQTCDPRLIEIIDEASYHMPCVVLEGHRPEVLQNEAFTKGSSKVKWPNSEHNKIPSRAVDVTPFPINFSKDPANLRKIYYFIGLVKGIAQMKGIKIRVGADFNGNLNFTDDSLEDTPHIELAEE